MIVRAAELFWRRNRSPRQIRLDRLNKQRVVLSTIRCDMKGAVGRYVPGLAPLVFKFTLIRSYAPPTRRTRRCARCLQRCTQAQRSDWSTSSVKCLVTNGWSENLLGDTSRIAGRAGLGDDRLTTFTREPCDQRGQRVDRTDMVSADESLILTGIDIAFLTL